MASTDDESNLFAAPAADDRIRDDQPHDGKIEYAGFVGRFVAFFIDAVIVFGVRYLLQKAFSIFFVGIDEPGMMRAIAGVSGIIVGWLYSAIQECSSAQATLGMNVVGIKVTDMEAKRVSFGRASGRYFAKFLSVLTMFVGFLIQPFTERRQALHDIVSGCLVIRQ